MIWDRQRGTQWVKAKTSRYPCGYSPEEMRDLIKLVASGEPVSMTATEGVLVWVRLSAESKRGLMILVVSTTVVSCLFAIVIIGGFGNVEGTILAGLLVGLIESYTTQFLDPGLIDIVVFALLLLTLAVRPTGLIAERREENV